MKSSRKPLQQALRTAIRRADLSWDELARRASVSERTLFRFMRRQGDIRLDTAERLAKVLGYELARSWG